MKPAVTLMFMSGVEDGKSLTLLAESGDGTLRDGEWVLTVGRQDDRDIPLQRDSFISREHARLTLRGDRWWLEDLKSRNGSYVELDGEEIRVQEAVALHEEQLFKIGRTWLRIQK